MATRTVLFVKVHIVVCYVTRSIFGMFIAMIVYL